MKKKNTTGNNGHSPVSGSYDTAHTDVNETVENSTPQVSDKGPFYHGTRANLKPGDLLTPGFRSNYKPGVVMNHIYFTAQINGAILAAALAGGNAPERIYIVEPTGSFENDPNLTDKKFRGNPTRSYRSQSPLKIISEVEDWPRLSRTEVQKWKDNIARLNGEIIN